MPCGFKAQCSKFYSSLIDGYCKNQRMDEAIKIFKQMQGGGVKPNIFTYNTLLDGLCKVGRMGVVQNLINLMVHQGVSPNIVTYTSLILGFVK